MNKELHFGPRLHSALLPVLLSLIDMEGLRFFLCTRLFMIVFYFFMTIKFSVRRGECARKALSGMMRGSRCWSLGTVALCCASARHCTETLQWMSLAIAVTLMLATETPMDKYLLVPFFTLQAPPSVISWIKGEYGRWTALFGLVMCLLCLIPGELWFLVSTMLLVILAPNQFMNLRGSPGGEVLSVAIAGYLMFQHFTGVGGLRYAFGREAIVTSLSIIFMTVITVMLVY